MIISLITLAVFAGALVVLFKVMTAIWHSPIFWIAAFALTVVLFPLTSGMSPLALVSMIFLRVLLVSRIFRAKV